jgi:ribosomal protein L29
MKHKQVAELERFVKDKTDELRVLRFDLAAGKVKDISKLHEARKAIARAKTFLNQHGQAN